MRTRTGTALLVITLGTLSPAGAQSLGTFRWQLQPYCNVLTVSITQVGGIYRAEGTDDQCGAATQGSVIGTAFPNPDGSIGLGFNIVATPGGRDVAVDAKVSLPGASGTWRDNTGATGTFALTPGAGTGGSPRPLTGSVGAAGINAAEVQRRISGACAAGQVMRSVNQDGTVACAPDAVGPRVTAGFGLFEQVDGASGATVLAVDINRVARRDHEHNKPAFIDSNVGIGGASLASAVSDIPVGAGAIGNVAVGEDALLRLTTGDSNVAIGRNSLESITTANGNTAVGEDSLRALLNGRNNTAVGGQALQRLSAGDRNIAIGQEAGFSLQLGSNNVYLASPGSAGEVNVIRIGETNALSQFRHTETYVAGIFNSPSASGTAVFVNASGRLGTSTSSRRFKQDITTVTDAARVIQALRPVRFLYKPEFDDGSRTPQYGLIAEEVAAVEPELAVLSENGTPDTVRYHFLAPLLVAEAQRLEQARAAQQQETEDLRAQLRVQAAELERLQEAVTALQSAVPAAAPKLRR